MPSGCWEWRRSTDGRYGQFYLCGVKFKSHVAAGLLWKGIVLRTRVWRHDCDNMACCNPEHLAPGTQKQNMQDAAERGRLKNGITKRVARRIRLLASRGTNYTIIGAKTGVHPTTAMRIVTGKLR